MKKLLLLVVILTTILGTQKIRGQCSQSWEMSQIPNTGVSLNTDPVNPPYSYQRPIARVVKELIRPDGSIVKAGIFSRHQAYNGTDSGIIQNISAPNGLVRFEPISGNWFNIPTPSLPNGSYPTNIWFVDDTLYANLDVVRKLDPISGVWNIVYVNGSPINKFEYLKPRTLPHEYIVVHKDNNNEVGGLKIWNSQLETLTPFLYSNNMAASPSIRYYMNEDQHGDTTCILFGSFPRMVINGFNNVFDFDSTLFNFYQNPNILNIKNPTAGFGLNPPYPLDFVNSIISINGNLFATGNKLSLSKGVWMKYNATQNSWDLLKEVTASWGNSFSKGGWYDEVDKKLYGLGIYDVENSTFTEIPQGFYGASMRLGNDLYSFGGLLKDITAPTAPNTTTPSGIVSIIGEQYLLFTGDNAHDGDLATMYDCCGNILHTLSIDATNCSNFVFNHLVPLGTNVYYFSLTDPSGNESTKTQITVVASNWPTDTKDVDKDFAFVHADSKTITVKGDINHIELLSTTGQVIFSAPVNSNQFTQSLDNIASGMYILKAINSKGEIMTKKLLLN